MIPAAYIAGRKLGKNTGWLVFVALAFTASMLTLCSEVISGGVVEEVYAWAPTIGLTFGLRVDIVSFVVALIIDLIGILASIYSISYMEHEEGLGAYFALLLMFVVGMLGVILSTNLIQFYIFWEFMIIPAIFLVAEWGSGQAKQFSFKTFIYARVGGFSLLFGILLTYLSLGTLNMYEIPKLINRMDSSMQVIVVTFFMIGFAIKMAILPLHTWLPDFHAEAPTPISALLSGVMIKCGAYAIARILVTFFTGVMTSLTSLFASLAVITMIYGGIMALAQTDLKRLLAYSSISQMGYIFFGLTTFSAVGLTGALFHVVNHAIFKGLLFMCAGAIMHATGTRDIRLMGGLRKEMPITFTACLIGALSLSGIPPLNGFWSKDLIIAAAYESQMYPFLIVMLISSALTFAYSLRWISITFLGEKSEHLNEKHIHEAPILMLAPILVLTISCFISGLLEIGLFGVTLANIAGPLGIEYAHIQIEAATVALSLLALVAGGIPVYFIYYRRKVSIYVLRTWRLGLELEKLVNEGFYFDKIYYKIFIDGTHRMCWIFNWVDGVLDALNRIFIDGTHRMCWIFNWVDGVLDALNQVAASLTANVCRRFYRWVDKPLDIFNYEMAEFMVSFSAISNTFDTKVLDGFVNRFANRLVKTAETVRRIQTGMVQHYVLAYLIGVILLALLTIMKLLGIW